MQGFVVDGVPISHQASSESRERWKRRVTAAARAAILADDKIDHVDIRIAIVYFHANECDVDVDNIVKPILDSMAGVAFGDDSQVAEIVARRTQLRAELELFSPSQRLLEALARGTDFIYISVTDSPIDHGRLP